MPYERKLINDPVHGFISLPRGLLYDLVRHPLMQRLQRIKQLGLSTMVYPGAQHTRFQHALGTYHLASQAIDHLTARGQFIFDSEAEAVKAAALMHDLGHGPFSHVLENTLIQGVGHEEISLLLMQRINHDLGGQLALAIRIFQDQYPKHFLHQLISGQVDMDRLDYLRRDSFYTGVSDGIVGTARIIEMLDVAADQLVIEAKGIYSIEQLLTARRLMYWQVYLHKTSVACERMLISALLRAKELTMSEDSSITPFAPPTLGYFLSHHVDRQTMLNDPRCLDCFAELDDCDVWSALKVWTHHPDTVLATLARGLVDRHTFKVERSDNPTPPERTGELAHSIANQLDITPLLAARYLVTTTDNAQRIYDPARDCINILYRDGSIRSIAQASDLLGPQDLAKTVKKYYLCYWRAK